MVRKFRYWFAGLVFSLVVLVEIVRLWLTDDDDRDPPHGAVLA